MVKTQVHPRAKTVCRKLSPVAHSFESCNLICVTCDVSCQNRNVTKTLTNCTGTCYNDPKCTNLDSMRFHVDGILKLEIPSNLTTFILIGGKIPAMRGNRQKREWNFDNNRIPCSLDMARPARWNPTQFVQGFWYDWRARCKILSPTQANVSVGNILDGISKKIVSDSSISIPIGGKIAFSRENREKTGLRRKKLSKIPNSFIKVSSCLDFWVPYAQVPGN